MGLLFQNLLAVPPLSSFFDFSVAFSVIGFGTQTLVYILVATMVRGVLWAVIVSLVVERLDAGRVGMSGVRRGLRLSPSVTGVLFVDVGLIYASRILGVLFGPSFGNLLFFGALVGGMYFLVFAPIVVIRDGVRPLIALGRSARAARLPGGRHVSLVLLYFFASFLVSVLAVPTRSGAFTVNPSVRVWVVVLATTVFHTIMLAAFAYRYGVVEEDVPPPRRRERRRGLLAGAFRR